LSAVPVKACLAVNALQQHRDLALGQGRDVCPVASCSSPRVDLADISSALPARRRDHMITGDDPLHQEPCAP